MATDPNWLYSTIAQSSAAIVAIIGGFITASVLMLSAEKRSIQEQKSEKETQVQAITKTKTDLQHVNEVNKAERFLRSELTKYPDDAIPTLEKILADYPSDYNTFFDKSILETEFLKLSIKQIKAKLFILKHVDKIDLNKYDSFLEWAKNRVSTEESIEIYDEYDKYIKRQKKLESTSDDADTLPSWIPRWSSNFLQDPPERELRELREEEKHSSEQDNIYNEIKKLAYQLILLKAEIFNLENRLATFAYPPNLWKGAAVLGFLAVLGVFLPVLIIAYEAFFTWAKVFTTVSFWLGIIGVFAFVIFQIRTLRRS